MTQAELTAIIKCVFEIANNGAGHTPIRIYSDSLTAVKAIAAYKIESSLVLECIRMLTELARGREVTLIWVPAHSNIEGNIRADALAKLGTKLHGPVQQPLITERLCRSTCNKWTKEVIAQRWQGTNMCRQAKQFVTSPNCKLADQLLTLDKLKMSVTIGILTGHIRLNAHLNKIGVRDDPDCDRCGGGAESAMHFLCECPGFSSIRKEIYEKDFLTPNEVMSVHINKIYHFVHRSGRFPTLGSRPITSQNFTGRGANPATLNVAAISHQSS